MSDYTIAELQGMLADKEAELAAAQSAIPVLETYERAIRRANDFENQIYRANNNGVNLVIGHNIKSSSENKQMTIQRIDK